jgi:FMN phosphatase YigB (HAD superfamily)
MIYIFDIDGTLADIRHRLHFIKSQTPDWPSFYKACVDDIPIAEVIHVAVALKKYNATILMITGRVEDIRFETVDWLRDHHIPCDGLYMREDGDHREDSVVKLELLADLREHFSPEEIMGVFEDREQVVKAYRSQGLRVFQIAEGKF